MKIFIVGGGFAGISAAKILSREISSNVDIYLIDKNKYTTMLPNLPEISAERLNREDITEDIEKLIPSSVKFINEEIHEINLDQKIIKTNVKDYNYDYMIFAPGSTTDFHGFNQHLEKLHVLDSLESAEKINSEFKQYIESTDSPTLVVSGAGFTGIELACNLYDLSKRKDKKINVILIQRSKKMLPMLSEKSASHALNKLDELGFQIYTDNVITEFDGNNVVLKSGKVIENVFLCWCSGVKTPLKPIGKYEALSDDRIIVNNFLSIPGYPEVYVAGDAAAIKDKEGNYLRRAVNFAQMSGKHAAINLAALIKNAGQQDFKPIDLGWVIPMYISSVGVAFGKEITGRKGIFLHYMICGVKNYNFKNFLKETQAAIKYPFEGK